MIAARTRTLAATVTVACLTAAVGYAALQSGGGDARNWVAILAILAIAGLASAQGWFLTRSSVERLAVLAALAFPVQVAFQLLPVPVALLELVSPTRAELTNAVTAVAPDLPRLATLSIAPERTVTHLARILGYVLVFFSVRSAAQRVRSPWLLLLPLIAIATIEAAIGLAQHLAGTPVAGTFGSRNFFGGLLGLVLPCALMMGVSLIATPSSRGIGRGRRVAAGVMLCGAAGLMFAAITLGLSRMAFLSCLGALGIVCILLVVLPLRAGPRIGAALALLVCGFFVVMLAPSDDLILRLGGTASDESLGGRLFIFADTLRMAAAYPLFGIGLGAYFPGLLRYQEHLLVYTVTNAHNDYLQLLSEVGLVGVVAPALLVVCLGVLIIRLCLRTGPLAERALPVACAGALAAMLIHSFGDFVFYVPANAAAFFWIAGVASTSVIGREADGPSATPMGPSFVWRSTPYLLSGAALLYSAGWAALHAGPMTPQREARFCTFGWCNSPAVRAAWEQQYGGVGSIPPEHLAELVRRDPAGPYAWCDLGESFVTAGDMNRARTCFDRALALAPHISYMLIRVARFHLAAGEPAAALELMSRALTTNPGWAEMVFADYGKWNVPTDQVLASGLPPTASVAGPYLMHLRSIGREQDARITWTWMVERGAVDDAVARRYVGMLTRIGRPAEAFGAWRTYAAAYLGDDSTGTVLSDGGFERDPQQVPFDWRLRTSRSEEGWAIRLDDEVKRSGTQALRVDFDGSANVTDIGVQQTVYLEPGRYRFGAWLRTEGVTTDQGVGFALTAEESPKLLDVATSALRGTNEWTKIEEVFDAPPGGGLVRVRVTRQRSFRLDNLVSGTVWIDDVRITPEP